MFQLSPPTMKVILSSGSLLTLIALGCLIVMSTSVHTSDIRERAGGDEAIGGGGGSGEAAATQASATVAPQAPIIAHPITSQASNSDEQQEARAQQDIAPIRRQASGGDSRHRSGRLYQQSHTQQQPQQQQQQSPLESYAAAYAAANSNAGADHQSALTQQALTVSSQSSDSSFGETPMPVAIAGGSIGQSARQLGTNPSDYSGQSNYFAGYMSPSSNEVSYNNPSGGLTSVGVGGGGGYYGSPSNLHHQHPHHHHHHKSGHHHQQGGVSPVGLAPGYPTNAFYEHRAISPISAGGYYDRIGHSSAAAASSPFWATSSLGSSSGGGLMSSASHALSHWTNGFSIGEIICGLVAIAIGAIILGAPFFLIYLALMGNFSGSGTLSLTNPTSATGAAGGAAAPANGRRKRLAVFEAMNMGELASNKYPDLAAMVDSVAHSLGPYVNLQQVSSTFKQLVRSIEKYSSSDAHNYNQQVRHSKELGS